MTPVGLNAMLQYSPIRPPLSTDREALLEAIKWQLQDFRTRLPLISPVSTADGNTTEIALRFQVWGMQYASRSTDVLTSYQEIADLFRQDGIEGRILILGEPGMGKTHTLIAVGQILLTQAQQGSSPIPVLINLSGWQGETLRTWLIDYLWEEYRIAKTIAEDWIDIPQLTFLFDGFDHLPTPQQRSCAHAIDTFLRTSPDQTAMLCCRRSVLEKSGITFNHFNSGVNIAPLAAQQVKDYTTALNRPELWQGIKGSKSLQLLARVPLHLTMLGVMYRGQTIANREFLLSTFMAEQLSQGKVSEKDQQALQWLAQKLENRLRTFRLDQLQATWLPSSRRVLYRLLVVVLLALIYGLIAGNLVLGAAIGLVASQIDLEAFPRYRLSLATASWQTLGVIALAASLAALAVGLLFGGLVALLLMRFGSGLSAFGWASSIGAIVGWCIALGGLLWGGVQNSIQLRTHPNQDVVNSLRNCTVLVGLLGIIIALLLVLPGVIANQPPLTLLNLQRIRLLVVGCLGAILWLSFGLQQAILRLLLLPGKVGGLPAAERSWLRRLASSGLLRPVAGGFQFCHDSIRQRIAETDLNAQIKTEPEISRQTATSR
jgi:hypothetical protein